MILYIYIYLYIIHMIYNIHKDVDILRNGFGDNKIVCIEMMD